jgi:hypothetical protein
MTPKMKLALVGGGAVLLLLVVAGTSGAATNPKPLPPPQPPPPPLPKPPPTPHPPGPHPPPWPVGTPTGTVRVAGYPGVKTRLQPSKSSPVVTAWDDGGAFNGKKVAILEEQVDASGRTWAHIWTPTGYEGWASIVDPQGNRNIYPDAQGGGGGEVPDVGGNMPRGPVDQDDVMSPMMTSEMSGLPREYVPDQVSGAHGWYPYNGPARMTPDPRRASPPPGQRAQRRQEPALPGFGFAYRPRNPPRGQGR